jgi:DNA repair ATPase RecN
VEGGEGPDRLSESQRAGLDARQADQDRTLAAMHRLEAALGSPASRPQWSQEVLAALTALDEATSDEASNAERPDSLLSDIARTQPRLRSRVHGVRAQYRQVRESVTSLRGEVKDSDPGSVDVADLRERLAWVTTALRHQRARESDLIYEAYYEAFRADLGKDGRDAGSA